MTDTYRGIIEDDVIEMVIQKWQNEESIRATVKNRSILYLGSFEDGRLLGLVNAHRMNKGMTVRLAQLYVLPEHQRKGIGTELMKAVIDHFRKPVKLVLDVEEANKKGISFYSRLGFTFTKRIAVQTEDHRIPCLRAELEVTIEQRARET